jgi:hypothetical protein
MSMIMTLIKSSPLRRRQYTDTLEQTLSSFEALKSDYLQKSLGQIHSYLRSVGDDKLIELAIRARHIECCAFILRGMCVYELRRRTPKLSGGRGKRDQATAGILSRMTELARAIRVSPKTLATDARIYEVFFAAMSETMLAREHILAREYYVTALAASDPHSAIREAIRRFESGEGCSRPQFRVYVRGLQLNLRTCKQSTALLKHCSLSVEVPRAVLVAFDEITRITGMSRAEELIAMIHERRAALRRRDRKRLPKQKQSHHTKTTSNKSPLQLTLEM